MIQPVILIVEPDASCASRLRSIVPAGAWTVVPCSTFEAARLAMQREFAGLVSNIRLRSFNGIHLAYIAKQANPEATAVLYTEREERSLAREAQRAGAFYERLEFLPYTLPALLGAALPPADRRSPERRERRMTFRGGRRVGDLPALHRPARGLEGSPSPGA
jgi:DNA-binding NtrC family response regulator